MCKSERRIAYCERIYVCQDEVAFFTRKKKFAKIKLKQKVKFLTFTFDLGAFRFIAVRLPALIMTRASVARLHQQQQQQDGDQSCQDQNCFTHLCRQMSNDRMMQFSLFDLLLYIIYCCAFGIISR